MRVIQVNNYHRTVGGSDVAVDLTIDLLQRRGIDVFFLKRNSKDLGNSLLGKFLAFSNGIYSASACNEMQRMIREMQPDIVHVHELFPFISPWVLKVCGRWNVPVVMTCHNFRLTCPTAHHVSSDVVCEMCKGGREYWCLLKNCRSNILESIAYALRNAIARKYRLLLDNVTLYISPSEFVKSRLVDAGILQARIIVVPNLVSMPVSEVRASDGKYAAYVGRISQEKGINTLLASARYSGLPLRLAGDYSPMQKTVATASPKVQFVGSLKREQLDMFYRNARFLVVSSICFETFCLVAAEAMSHGLPVIASRIGALPEVVEDGITGLLFEPGNSEDLASKMKFLWENPDLCQRMGLAGREKAIKEYSEDVYYDRLMAAYEKAISIR